MIHARERQQGTTADSHSLEEAQFKTLRSACSLKPESQIENRIRCVTLGYPSLLPDTPGIFALRPSLFTSAVECLSGRLHSTTLSLERDENSLVWLIFRYSIEFPFSLPFGIVGYALDSINHAQKPQHKLPYTTGSGLTDCSMSKSKLQVTKCEKRFAVGERVIALNSTSVRWAARDS